MTTRESGLRPRDGHASLVGEDNGLDAVSRGELVEHVADVGLDGVVADDESWAISAFQRPRAIAARTSCSLGVSVSTQARARCPEGSSGGS